MTSSTRQKPRAAASHRIDPAEWDARVKLAACYRMVAKLGMDDMIYNHISARVPGHEDQFLINPYGLLFDEITASSLVKINTSGEKLDDTPHSVNVAGFVIHAAIHTSNHDAACVLPDDASEVGEPPHTTFVQHELGGAGSVDADEPLHEHASRRPCEISAW